MDIKSVTKDYVECASGGSVTAPNNGSWISAYAIALGATEIANGSWLQTLCEQLGITQPVNSSWVIALANYYGISQPVNGSWWYAIADEACNGVVLPTAEFSGLPLSLETGNDVQYTDLSTTNGGSAITDWSWQFEGGTPATSTAQNPLITYNSVGDFDVELTITNAEGSDGELKQDYIAVTAPAFTGILDTYTGAEVAYSFRQLRGGYTGDCIEVEYGDGTTEDIGFVNNVLDSATLVANALAKPGGTARILTWYDQSGNANDATAVNLANAPEIVGGGGLITENGKAAAFTSGYQSMNFTKITSPESVWGVGDQLSTNTVNYLAGSTTVGGAVSNGGWFSEISALGVSKIGVADSRSPFATTDPTPIDQFVVGYDFHGGNWKIALDGDPFTTATPAKSDKPDAQYLWGRGSVPGLGFAGNAQEMIIWPTSQQANRAGIFADINTYYSIYSAPTPLFSIDPSTAPTGTTVPDASGNGNDGTSTNVGHDGTYYTFTGTGDNRIEWGDIGDPLSDITIIQWINVDDTNRRSFMFKWNDTIGGAGNRSVANEQNGGNWNNYLSTNGGWQGVGASVTQPGASVWAMMALTYNATTGLQTMTIGDVTTAYDHYGSSTASPTSGNPFDSASPWTFGVQPFSTSFNDPFKGSLGHVQVYTQELTATDIQAVWNSTKSYY